MARMVEQAELKDEAASGVSSEPTGAAEEDRPYVPRTELGRLLMEIRARIVASGQPLLDWKGVQREVAERRGGISGR